MSIRAALLRNVGLTAMHYAVPRYGYGRLFFRRIIELPNRVHGLKQYDDSHNSNRQAEQTRIEKCRLTARAY